MRKAAAVIRDQQQTEVPVVERGAKCHAFEVARRAEVGFPEERLAQRGETACVDRGEGGHICRRRCIDVVKPRTKGGNHRATEFTFEDQ